MQRGEVLPLILAGILILVVVAGGAYYLGNSSGTKPSSTPVLSQTPQSSPSPSRHEDPWQNYKSGRNLDGIIINYPKGWRVNYRKEYNLSSDYTAKYRIAFDFAPPGWSSHGSVDWLGWGSLDFDVYDLQKDINQWIDKYLPKYKNGLLVKEDTKIGDKQTFLISTDGKMDWSDGWIPRDVILGSNYIYELSHSQDGSDDFAKALNNKLGIFQYIHIN